jgi:hypothetical protein
VLLRGGRREAEPEAAVVALEVDGEGVEIGGEDDDAVAPAPVEGSGVSVNEDMLRHNPARYRLANSNLREQNASGGYVFGCV